VPLAGNDPKTIEAAPIAPITVTLIVTLLSLPASALAGGQSHGSQLQFHYVDQCDEGRNAFRRISLNSVIMTRTGKFATCFPQTVDNEPVRDIRCPLCTVANCPTRRGYDGYASIGPTPQCGRRRKPGNNRSSGRLWSHCSRRRDNHDLCP
jgi:hypothetical protein